MQKRCLKKHLRNYIEVAKPLVPILGTFFVICICFLSKKKLPNQLLKVCVKQNLHYYRVFYINFMFIILMLNGTGGLATSLVNQKYGHYKEFFFNFNIPSKIVVYNCTEEITNEVANPPVPQLGTIF